MFYWQKILHDYQWRTQDFRMKGRGAASADRVKGKKGKAVLLYSC